MTAEKGTLRELLDREGGRIPRVLNVFTQKKYPPVVLFLVQGDPIFLEGGGIVVKGSFVDYAVNFAELNQDTEVVMLPEVLE